jgi:hypothetical protein
VSALAIMYVEQTGAIAIGRQKPIGSREVAMGEAAELTALRARMGDDGKVPGWVKGDALQCFARREEFICAVRRELRS